MSGKLPVVRLPAIGPDDGGDGRHTPVLELPPNSKFGIAYPSEPIASAIIPAPRPVPSAINPGEPNALLSSGSEESEMSDEESGEDSVPAVHRGPPSPVQAMNRTGGAQSSLTSDEELYAAANDYTPTTELSHKASMRGTHPPEDSSTLLSLPIGPPRLSRAFSMPSSSELRHLQHPHHASVTNEPLVPSSATIGHNGQDSAATLSRNTFREISLEFADSVQMVVQTLLHVSPPQLLDPAKEQYAACQLTVPTPSMSAMLTAMKNLNYMSANMSRFSSPSSSPSASTESLGQETPPIPQDEYDIGEMLQSVGDALSGVAANAGIEIVLFHGDVGMKHVYMKGDECGLSYALLHIARQIINTAGRGDTIEIGLYIIPATLKAPKEGFESSLSASTSQETPLPSPPPTVNVGIDLETQWTCTFNITHRFTSLKPEADRVTVPAWSSSSRSPPQLDGRILRRLLSLIGADLDMDLPLKSPESGRRFEMSVTLQSGSAPEQVAHSPDEAIWHSDKRVQLAQEPTLDELTRFLDSLRGKSMTLYSAPNGAFPHHLTSYLTAWGLDVSHVSLDESLAQEERGNRSKSTSISTVPEDSEEETTNSPRNPDSSFVPPSTMPSPGGIGLAMDGFTAQIPPTVPGSFVPTMGAVPSLTSLIILIDDDVNALRQKLLQQRADASPLNMRPRKRPSLTSNHRPRSSPMVTRATTGPTPPAPSSVIVHFTSLANYKLVKEVMQSIMPPIGSTFRLPEVIVILKPAGPRRFLTALHTAITKPVVDPFFSPIATSPNSPNVYSDASPFFGQPRKMPFTRPGGSRSNSDRSERSARSPKEHPMAEHVAPLPSPLGASDGMEYFAAAAVALGTSPSSGLVIQSPDGQPAGIFFHPKKKHTGKNPGQGPSTVATSVNLTGSGSRGGPQYASFLLPGELRSAGDDQPPPNSRRGSGNRTRPSPRLQPVPEVPSQRTTPQPLVLDPTMGRGMSNVSNGSWEDSPASAVSQQTMPVTNTPISILGESSQFITENVVATRRNSTSYSPEAATPARRPSRRPTADKAMSPPPSFKKAKAADPTIVPPISVLIVEDNPINQNVLCMFMKKKKIKYEVANNGQQAVDKWKNGNFHLILMDIQMPIMDGIDATKEIRRLEKLNFGHAFPGTPQTERGTPSEAASTVSSLGGSSPFRSSVIIVALTASSRQSDRVAALAAGCNDFLTKPVLNAWLNSKIIEWGSIKALQMWSDLRPEVVKSITSGQVAQAKHVAEKLHVPEGRSTPVKSQSRTTSPSRQAPSFPPLVSGQMQNDSKIDGSDAKPPPMPDTQPVRSDTISSVQTIDSVTLEPHPTAVSIPPVVARTLSDPTDDGDVDTPRPPVNTEVGGLELEKSPASKDACDPLTKSATAADPPKSTDAIPST